MNKTKMTLAATGGAIGVAILVMAWFVWSAYSAKTAALEGDDEEGTAGLESVQSTANDLSHKSVYPCAESVRAIETNTATVAAWQAQAAKLAARGDRPVRKTTPAQFKTDIVEEAKRLAALPGSVGGKLVGAEFAFGPFKPYVAEGKMPSEAELATLVRQWDDVVKIVETLASSGIGELVDVQFKAAEKKSGEEEDQPKVKKGKKKSGKGGSEAVETKATSFGYVFTFTTRAPGLVKAVNALTTDERFVIIDALSFVREKDVIAAALGGDEKKAEAQVAGGRRGRRARRAAVEVEKKDPDEEAKGKNGIITDPLLDAPLKVTLTATVYDFGSLAEEKAEEKGEAK